jgi:hypothetical protein
MNDPKILDRAEGALIGSALGDTIGIYTGRTTCVFVIKLLNAFRTTEFMTAEQARAAYGGASPNFTLVPPETPLYNDHHRCKLGIISSVRQLIEMHFRSFSERKLAFWVNRSHLYLYPAGMDRRYRPYDSDGSFLFAPAQTVAR